MRPEDIGRIVTVSDPAVSPDGSQVAYVVTPVDLDGNDYRSAVWLAAADGSVPPRQLTAGEHGDASPRWSPDGTRIAFTSSRPALRSEAQKASGRDRHSLHVVPVTYGGETVTIARRDEGFAGVAWSPDGTRVAFASRVRAERYEPEDETARPPRRVDRFIPRLDGVGWTIDRPTQVFVVAADGAATPRRLTDGPWEHGTPTWSPDGTMLAFVAARHPDADLDVVNDVYLLAVDDPGAQPQRLTTRGDSSYDAPAWSPDGRAIATLATRGRIGYRHPRLTVVDAETGDEHVRTADLDLTCAPYPGARPPVWTGTSLVTSVEDRGKVYLLQVGPDGGTERLGAYDGWVTGFDLAGGTLAFTATTATQPSELWVRRDGEERRLTHHQRELVTTCPPRPAEHFAVRSEDGTELDAWIIRPTDFDPARRHPVLLNVHGGPHTQYGDKWFDEFQIYAAAGYAVVYGNPHGSTGRSEAFARSILSPRSPEDPGTGWGGIDYHDCMAIMDAALERFDFLDPARMGVMGGSYGGYMTSWVIGHTDRFAAAVSERAVNNLLSLEWSSDVAGYFRHEMGVDHLDAPDEYLRMSPVTYVRDIATPVCIIHSEDDLRCHVEQADCLWVALRMLGKDYEYYRFTAEGHELTRSGSPRHRVQRAELVLDWFARRLRPAAGEQVAPPGTLT